MEIATFKGLNNVTDPLRVGPEWLAVANNINVTDTGGLEKREGYSLSLSGSITGSFSTFDFSRMYIVDAGNLCATDGVTKTVLKTGLSGATMFWTEVNGQVFYNNGTDSGIIGPDNTVIPWVWTAPNTPALAPVTGSLPAGNYSVALTFTLPDGRMTGDSFHDYIALNGEQALQISDIPQLSGYKTNVFISPADSTVFQYAGSPTGTAWTWNAGPDSLGYELQTALLDPLPTGTDVVQFWRGRMYAAQYMPSVDQTVVWFSQPLTFHLFNSNSNFLMVPGRVLMLAPTEDALIIGTDVRIHAYDGAKMAELAEYGVVPGQHWDQDNERILFWTKRGVCQALPFKNLTESQVSVAPGVSAGGTVVHRHGQKRYVVVLKQGGSAFNSYL